MLVIRKDGSTRLLLDRLLSKAEGYGIWEFHISANSEMFPKLLAGRHAAISPAEPKEGQEVEMHVMLRPNAPQEEWKLIGKGVAHYRQS
ncbi:MAG: hypothetical protein GAK45_02340 [Pseudomonas citronellolis]|nr:MAG: hypothetical protein GAK45_02340 [Pseudomonas citronellolis]